MTQKDLRSEKWEFEIWLKNLNPFLGKSEIRVKDSTSVLPITGTHRLMGGKPQNTTSHLSDDQRHYETGQRKPMPPENTRESDLPFE